MAERELSRSYIAASGLGLPGPVYCILVALMPATVPVRPAVAVTCTKKRGDFVRQH
ncbi:hypothetical protein GQ53DRAFT_745931, partial [Thozetella sp. PMI_491]